MNAIPDMMFDHPSTEPSSEERARLAGLFAFAGALLRAGAKPLYRMQDTGLGHFPEHEFHTLPGLTLDESDEVWLRLERLQPAKAPKPPANVRQWLDGSTEKPDTPPSVTGLRTLMVSLEEASDLCEGELLDLADIHEFEEGDEEVRIELHLDRLVELRADIERWVQGPWRIWAEAERPVRRAMEIYGRLFTLCNRMHGGGTTTPQMVWGIGIATLRRMPLDIEMPLLEQLVDLELEDDGSLVIMPRATRPVLGLQPFLDSDSEADVRARVPLNRALAGILDVSPARPTPFDPARWEDLLGQAAALLSADGRHIRRADIEPGTEPQEPGPILEVMSRWALYARPRSESDRTRDLEQLAERVVEAGAGSDRPPWLSRFVGDLDDTTPAEVPSTPLTVIAGGAPDSDWGRSGRPPSAVPTTTGTTQSSRYYFPLPFNDEQAKIIDLLERESVVTVAGPPGTGKTHTIANILAHYMAEGKRVLVTARTAEAIKAVRDKLPDDLASLVIASTGSDLEATRQLETAVKCLSDEVTSLNEDLERKRSSHLEEALRHADAELDELDRELAAIARANLDPLRWQGEERTVMEVAELLAEEDSAHGWFPDAPAHSAPSTLDVLVEELRETLPEWRADLPYVGLEIDMVESTLPSTQALLEVHDAAQRRRAEPAVTEMKQPVMARNTTDADEQAEDMLLRLDRAREKFDKQPDWIRGAVGATLAAGYVDGASEDLLKPLVDVCRSLHGLEVGEFAFEAGNVEREKLTLAIKRGCRGERPVSRFELLRGSALSKALSSFVIDGSNPVDASDWICVRDTLRAEESRSDIELAWAAVSARLDLPKRPSSFPALVEQAREIAARSERIRKAAIILRGYGKQLETFFPFGLDVRGCLSSLDFDALTRALRANLEPEDEEPVALERLEALSLSGTQALHEIARELHDSAAAGTVASRDIVSQRSALTQELSRVKNLLPALCRLDEALDTLGKSGAPGWEAACRSPENSIENLLRDGWRESWEHARMRARLDAILLLGGGEDIREKMREIHARRTNDLQALIRCRALLGLKPRMSDRVRSALHAFSQATRRRGRGADTQSGRHWGQQARLAATEASPAAPVWIMPEYKIAEQFSADLGAFDLVILDEASQSDITSIGSLARGQKCLIVGDDQQVSPSSVGLPADRVDMLRQEHIAMLPKRKMIDQNTSIFDLAVQMFPRTHLMLREHFRCVEPIIRFSAARYYQNRLLPLRVPKASERLDPPIVDMYVRGAERLAKTNVAEATVIVDEIARIVADEQDALRDIAVISLIGREQANLIERLILDDQRIGPEAITRHGIICGDARTLQGQERSIVFLSMVAVPENVRAQSTPDFNQRVNVAMSRARDRLYLVRSVKVAELRPSDVKRAILEHVADPMPEGGSAHDQDTLDRCESGFEQDVCRALMDAGYRTRSQVSAGPYCIDLVVEGRGDRRLAIELDGDAFHGPDVWDADMRRQRTLERGGWTFWRVFGSQWTTNREHFWSDLLGTLTRMGIDPIGAEASGGSHTQVRVFEAFDGGVRRVLDDEAESVDEEQEPESAEANVVKVSPSSIPLHDTDDSAPTFESKNSEEEPEQLDEPRPAQDRVIPLELELDLGGVVSPPGLVEERIGDEQARPETSQAEEHEVCSNTMSLPSEPVEVRYDGDAFYDPEYRSVLRGLCERIVSESGPVDAEYLFRQVAGRHGFSRMGARIQNILDEAIGEEIVSSRSPDGTRRTFWPDDESPKVWIEFRAGPVNGVTRTWEELPWPEQIGLARQVLAEGSDCPQRAMLSRLGVSRLGSRLNRETAEVICAAKDLSE